jgi:hypothetical protein
VAVFLMTLTPVSLVVDPVAWIPPPKPAELLLSVVFDTTFKNDAP